MKKNRDLPRPFYFLVVIAIVLLLLGMGKRRKAPPQREERKPTVERVIDGDTFVLTTGERVRLIGVDTPELQREDMPVQYYGEEARRFLKRMVEGKQVSLKSDWQSKDQYERTLAYVYVEDTIFVNLEIVKQGYGFVCTRYPFEYMESFRKCQRQAMANSTGLWGRKLSQDTTRTIDPSDAHGYYGEKVIVEGKIVRTYNSGKACFLNFHEDWKNHLTAVIFATDFENFPDSPEKHYLGKRVRIIGKIKKYKGAPEIVLNDATEIEVLERPNKR